MSADAPRGRGSDPAPAVPPVTTRAPKQEQEPASTDVVEVAPGIIRMQLPVWMPGLAHVNMYGFLDDRGLAVVDPGLPGPRSYRELRSRLSAAGFRVADVHTVVVTHSHPDHYGGATRLAEEAGGCRILTHRAFAAAPRRPSPRLSESDEADAELVAAELAQELDVEALDIPAIGDVDTSADHFDDPAAGGEGTGHWSRVPWGGRDERPPFARRVAHRARMVPFYARHPRQLADRTRRALGMRGSLFELPEPTHRVRHGQPVELSGREWVSVHTPGHTVDHLCLFDPEHGILVSGDHVLPTITPHVAGVGVGMDSLKSYLRTLDVVASLDGVRLALPAHGHPFDDVPGRVDAIKEHHAERMEHLRTASIALGPSTVPQLCHEIFPERHWGPMAESETFAHLEHLVGEDLADRTRASDGALLYQAR